MMRKLRASQRQARERGGTNLRSAGGQSRSRGGEGNSGKRSGTRKLASHGQDEDLQGENAIAGSVYDRGSSTLSRPLSKLCIHSRYRALGSLLIMIYDLRSEIYDPPKPKGTGKALPWVNG
jgi:hypothetical protein